MKIIFQLIKRNISSIKMRVLNVAEKNDAAKNIAFYLAKGNAKKREGISKFNKIYEFDYNLFGQRCHMVMTSVSGHLLALEFATSFRKWESCSPLTLFEAPVFKFCPKDHEAIKHTLEREVRTCDSLIIWTDCDREGENIGFEVIKVCTDVKPNLRIYRAKFSEITAQSVHRAVQNLNQPDKRQSDAVEVRMELDLRIGAAFTRFQTLRLKKVFPRTLADSLISYGSCQFPTLGFVVERYKAVQSFIPEPFWKIKATHTIGNLTVDYSWKRVRLFDQLLCQILYEDCLENPTAKVVDVQTKPKSKWRPLPLDTVELEKLASRKLKLNAKETMKIAERLYTQGLISYPRTETNIFPKEMNLSPLVEMQVSDSRWGDFASQVLREKPNPRAGKKSDQAHPPIHPTKYTNSLQGNEQKLYEFIVRHFLACCSKDAQGFETIVEIDIAKEKFVAHGLMITAYNYLDVYPYEKWNAKEIHIYQVGQIFEPTSIDMTDGETSPPHLLTEADLIALMEKHGIGTDATHADHIETIKSRLYVGIDGEQYFVPGQLGMGLVEGYDNMGIPMSKPNLRAELEADLKRICDGTRDPKEVLAEQLRKYKEVFRISLQQAASIDNALNQYLEENMQDVVATDIAAEEASFRPVLKCVQCGLDMVIKERHENGGWFLTCVGYPGCRHAIWFPGNVEQIQALEETCVRCGPNYRKVKFKFRRGSFTPFYMDTHVGCLGGCDEELLERLDIRLSSVKSRNSSLSSVRSSADSGFVSVNHNTSHSSIHTHCSSRNSRTLISGGNSNTTQRSISQSNADVNYSQSNSFRSNIPKNNSSWQMNAREQVISSQRQVLQDNQQENIVVCSCNQNAILLTVKKEGPNKGKQFYKCNNVGQQCNFFLWADESNKNRNETQMRPLISVPFSSHQNPGEGNSGDIVCSCGLPCRLLTVQKDTPNKGRQFYSCSKSQQERCTFFLWADDPSHNSNNQAVEWPNADQNWERSGRGSRNSRGKGVPPTRGKSGGPKQRLCSICKQEGHNKKNCPNGNC